MSDAETGATEYKPIVLDPNTPVTPYKRKPGRPKGAKNKKRGHSKYQPKGVTQPGGFVKGDSRIVTGEKNFRDNPPRYMVWRERMKRAKELVFTEEVLKDLLCEAIAIAKTHGHPEQARMIEFCVEQAVGRASSKLEVTSDTQNITVEQRIINAQIYAGLIQPSEDKPITVHSPRLIEGEVVEDATSPSGTSDGVSEDAGLVPAVPETVHRGQGEEDHL